MEERIEHPRRDTAFLRLAGVLDFFNEHIGRAVAWLVLFMVLTQFTVVVMRYAFGLGWIPMQEAIIYMHGVLFLLIAGYTLAHNGHVRVDVFHERFSERNRAWIEIFGAALFLLPLCVFIAWTSLPYVMQSWEIRETSREGTGIPAIYLLKTTIPVFAILLGLQGVANVLRAIDTLRMAARE